MNQCGWSFLMASIGVYLLYLALRWRKRGRPKGLRRK